MHVRSDSMALTTMVFQQFSTLLLILAAIGMTGATLGALFGVIPWITLPLGTDGTDVVTLERWPQAIVTLFLLALLGFLPANARVRRLEVTNRDFHISMQDVARAYDAVHRADRDGAFELSREFDAMRDRIAWMREHPDLSELEPDILQLAAQMSVESRDLAAIYTSERVERAHTFLRQRQQEVEDYRQRIAMAQSTVHEIRRWMQAIEVEEGLAETQLERLQKDLDEITDTLEIVEEYVPENVVQIERQAPREAGHRAGKTEQAKTTKAVRDGRRALLGSLDEETDPDLEILLKG